MSLSTTFHSFHNLKPNMKTTAFLISTAIILDIADTQTATTEGSTSSSVSNRCNEKISIMGVNVLNNGSLLSTCSKGPNLSVSNVSQASKLPPTDLQRICMTPACLKPFEDLSKSSDLISCVVNYDNKDQNLAGIAKDFVQQCTGSSGSKKSNTEKDVKADDKVDDKGTSSGGIVQSFSLLLVAATALLLALN